MRARRRPYLFCKLHKILAGRIGRREKIADEEDNQDKLNRRADGVVLVRGLNVADEHRGAWDLLEVIGDLVDGVNHKPLRILEIHLQNRGSEEACQSFDRSVELVK